MKNLFLLLCLGFSTSLFSQVYVGNVNINERKVQYLEVWEKYNKDSDRFYAMVDYGQQDNREDKSGVKLRMTNPGGQDLEFNGIVNILNFLHTNGWDVLHVKTIGDYESFIMTRRNPMDNNFRKETANKSENQGG